MTDKKSDKAKTKSGQSIKETLPQKTVSRKNQKKNVDFLVPCDTKSVCLLL